MTGTVAGMVGSTFRVTEMLEQLQWMPGMPEKMPEPAQPDLLLSMQTTDIVSAGSGNVLIKGLRYEEKDILTAQSHVSAALMCLEGKTCWLWDQGEAGSQYLCSGTSIFEEILHKYLFSGAGKTSLLRVLRGLWPGGQGVVTMVGGDQVGFFKDFSIVLEDFPITIRHYIL